MSSKIKDPRFAGLQVELRLLNQELKKLRTTLWNESSHIDIHTISKGSTFTDTEIPCLGASLVQVSTDGDMSDLSYKVKTAGGQSSATMKADESPHVVGPVHALLITNAQAQSGKYIRITRYLVPPLALPAIQHGTAKRTAYANLPWHWRASKVEYASSASNYFETDQALGDTPTLTLDGMVPNWAQKFRIDTLKFQITPTNAVTYQLYLLEDAQAVDERSESDVIFDSGAGMVGGTHYIVVPGGLPVKLPITVFLATAATLYYMVDWSAAPGDSIGYIKALGQVMY